MVRASSFASSVGSSDGISKGAESIAVRVIEPVTPPLVLPPVIMLFFFTAPLKEALKLKLFDKSPLRFSLTPPCLIPVPDIRPLISL
ncbi:hypothetical protein D3C85_976980 [compost metagenome]